ncbi:MAG: cytochrome c [Alphaproteobacteria bacterium]|nr:cytochrome c [Alphaproteobacteria bacterium]MCW5740881.1 cytochrome c [Alphaproteobacteria bacterium]
MRKGLIVGAIGLALSGALVGTVLAQATDPIAARKDNRKQAGAAMKAIKGIIDAKGATSGAQAHAAKIKELTVAHTKLYPKGSDKGDTKALPVIWTDWAGFEAANTASANAADAMAAAAGSGSIEALTAAFGATGKTCGACHEKYRAK